MILSGYACTDVCVPGQISYERGFTMIATHNIKVNGRWVAAGEEYKEEAEKKPARKPAEPKAEKPAEEEKAAEPVQEEKPKNTSRRRKTSEE